MASPRIGDMFYWQIIEESFGPDEEWIPADKRCGIVTAVNFPYVSFTPIYDPDHKKWYGVKTVDEFWRGKREFEHDGEEAARESAAECAAENAVPQWMVW